MPILPKLALTFLAVLTPLFYIGFQMNEAGSDIVREEIGKSLVSRIELYMDILNNDFEQTIRLQREYMYDEDLIKLSTISEIMPPAERNASILRLKNRMDLLKGSSSFVENAMAFIPALNRIVSSNANAVDEFDSKMFQALTKPDNMFSLPFTVWDDRLFVCMSYPGGEDPQEFLLAVEISKKALTTKLQQIAQDNSMAVLMGSEREWRVASFDDQNMDEQWLRELENIDAGTEPVNNVSLGQKNYLLVSKESSFLNARLNLLTPTVQIEEPLHNYRNWMFILYGVAVLVIIAFSFSMYRIIHRPLKLLVRSFRKIEQGRFDIAIEYQFTDEFGYLYKQLNAMVRELKRLIHEVYEQQYRVRIAELRHLQSQINPHFLYNTFFILYRMAKQEGNENIVRLTKHLGEYFEFITRDGTEEVMLSSEAAHAKSYTELQSIRFSNRIMTTFSEIPKQAEQILVPRLILQPIIENAFVHSLEKKAKGGQLEIDFTITETELAIRIEDSGGVDELDVDRLRLMLNSQQDVTEVTGMVNVHRRLKIKYGNQAGLQLSQGELGGLKIIIIIPIKENEGYA